MYIAGPALHIPMCMDADLTRGFAESRNGKRCNISYACPFVCQGLETPLTGRLLLEGEISGVTAHEQHFHGGAPCNTVGDVGGRISELNSRQTKKRRRETDTAPARDTVIWPMDGTIQESIHLARVAG